MWIRHVRPASGDGALLSHRPGGPARWAGQPGSHLAHGLRRGPHRGRERLRQRRAWAGAMLGALGQWVCGVAAPCASGGMRHVWIGRDALLSLERRGDRCSWSSVVRAMLTDPYMQNMVVSSGRGHIFSRGGLRPPAPLPACVLCARAARRFRQPAPLNSCFQLGYSLLKFTKDLLKTCLQLAYSLLTACLQLAYSLPPASLPSGYICYRSSFNP